MFQEIKFFLSLEISQKRDTGSGNFCRHYRFVKATRYLSKKCIFRVNLRKSSVLDSVITYSLDNANAMMKEYFTE